MQKKKTKKKKREAELEQLEEDLPEELLWEGSTVTVGPVVVLEHSCPDFEEVPPDLTDMVIEFRLYENKIICHRGVGKFYKYWWDKRTRFVDRRVVSRVEFPKFKGVLRPYQAEGIRCGILAEEGIFQLPTGSGKTVMGIGLAAELSQRTLWVTTNTLLLKQTADSVRKFLGIEPTILGGGKDDVSGDFVIATFQSLIRRVYEIRNRFGTVIFDEAHHIAADSILDICSQLPAKYRFGLTATARRRDKRNAILQQIIGPVIVSPTVLSMASYLVFPTVRFVRTGMEFDQPKWPEVLGAMRDSDKRNAMICLLALKQGLKNERILVLSRLVEHVGMLHDKALEVQVALAEKTGNIYTKGIFEVTGETPSAIREQTLEAFRQYGGIMFATEELCGEGFDMPELDILILTMPAGEIRGHQRAGRLMRMFKSEQEKYIFDFADNGTTPERLAEKRKNEYISMALTMGDDLIAK